MSQINREVTNELVIPVIESDIFRDRRDAAFAVGMIAVGDQALLGLQNEYNGYFDLRRKVYVDQTGQLHESEIGEDGTDRDEDDKRSVAFGIVENRGYDQRIVAATRLIIKGFPGEVHGDKALPVEEFCPDLFADNPAPARSIEVSRLIARHEKPAVQKILEQKIHASALAYVVNHNLGPAYAVIEPWLERHLNGHVPIERLAEPRYIEHYLDYNLPIQIHVDKFMDKVEDAQPGTLSAMREAEGAMSYFGKFKPAAVQSNPVADYVA